MFTLLRSCVLLLGCSFSVSVATAAESISYRDQVLREFSKILALRMNPTPEALEQSYSTLKNLVDNRALASADDLDKLRIIFKYANNISDQNYLGKIKVLNETLSIPLDFVSQIKYFDSVLVRPEFATNQALQRDAFTLLQKVFANLPQNIATDVMAILRSSLTSASEIFTSEEDKAIVNKLRTQIGMPIIEEKVEEPEPVDTSVLNRISTLNINVDLTNTENKNTLLAQIDSIVKDRVRASQGALNMFKGFLQILMAKTEMSDKTVLLQKYLVTLNTPSTVTEDINELDEIETSEQFYTAEVIEILNTLKLKLDAIDETSLTRLKAVLVKIEPKIDPAQKETFDSLKATIEAPRPVTPPATTKSEPPLPEVVATPAPTAQPEIKTPAPVVETPVATTIPVVETKPPATVEQPVVAPTPVATPQPVTTAQPTVETKTPVIAPETNMIPATEPVTDISVNVASPVSPEASTQTISAADSRRIEMYKRQLARLNQQDPRYQAILDKITALEQGTTIPMQSATQDGSSWQGSSIIPTGTPSFSRRSRGRTYTSRSRAPTTGIATTEAEQSNIAPTSVTSSPITRSRTSRRMYSSAIPQTTQGVTTTASPSQITGQIAGIDRQLTEINRALSNPQVRKNTSVLTSQARTLTMQRNALTQQLSQVTQTATPEGQAPNMQTTAPVNTTVNPIINTTPITETAAQPTTSTPTPVATQQPQTSAYAPRYFAPTQQARTYAPQYSAPRTTQTYIQQFPQQQQQYPQQQVPQNQSSLAQYQQSRTASQLWSRQRSNLEAIKNSYAQQIIMLQSRLQTLDPASSEYQSVANQIADLGNKIAALQ